jgi:hypothetical protein
MTGLRLQRAAASFTKRQLYAFPVGCFNNHSAGHAGQAQEQKGEKISRHMLGFIKGTPIACCSLLPLVIASEAWQSHLVILSPLAGES